jgi:hypothetical protein
VRLQAIVLTQGELFGTILLRKHKMFDVVFSGGAGAASGDGSGDAAGESPKTIDENYL